MRNYHFFLLLLFGTQLKAQICFEESKMFFSGTRPSAALAADFNRDGYQDLAMVDYDYSGFSISLGDGSGNYFLDSSYQLNFSGSIPGLILSKDFNRDGFIDLATVDYLGKIYIHLGKGDGTFQTKISTIPGFYPSGLCSADFNGDAIPDIVVSSHAPANNITIYFGNDSGGFNASQLYSVEQWPQDIITLDINRDGKMDLISANGGGGTGKVVTFLIGNGDGSFYLGQKITTEDSPTKLLGSDFNSDGWPDLGIITKKNILILISSSNGGFLPTDTIPVMNQIISMIANDFNGDKKNDLVVTQKDSNYISVYLGNGNGYFSDSLNFKVANLLGDLCSADFNNDGKQDIALTRGRNYFTGDVRILLNCTSTGIENVIDNSELTIYPNPSSDKFSIESSTSNINKLELFDMNSKLLITQNFKNKAMLDVTGLKEGVFLLCIHSMNGVFYRKLVVAR
jgi:hypothetical protein